MNRAHIRILRLVEEGLFSGVLSLWRLVFGRDFYWLLKFRALLDKFFLILKKLSFLSVPIGHFFLAKVEFVFLGASFERVFLLAREFVF